jgi:hypothetical protein
LKSAEPGFTIVVACHARFPEMLVPNFAQLIKQDLTGLHSVLIAFDSRRNDRLSGFEAVIRAKFPTLNIRCLYQSAMQSRATTAIAWGWVDCWLSYCKGIAEATTRYVFLHDMDAILLRPGIVAERYKSIQQGGEHFLGTRWYTGCGITPSNRLCYIVEMMLDARMLRERFRPIDLFGKICLLNGVSVDLDILLRPQLGASRSVLPLSYPEWIHPSQVISQFTYLMNQPGYIPPELNNLFFIPYFIDQGGNEGIIEKHVELFRSANPRDVPFLGYRMDVSRLSVRHLRWVIKQLVHLEYVSWGEVRPKIRAYLDTIQSLCLGAPAESLIPEVVPEVLELLNNCCQKTAAIAAEQSPDDSTQHGADPLSATSCCKDARAPEGHVHSVESQGPTEWVPR